MSMDERARVAASVRARLLTLSKGRNEDYNLVLTRYVLERFLYRLSRSPHRNEMILKGAMLFQLWDAALLRPTHDLDLLASGDVKAADIETKIRAICSASIENEDGVEFDLTRLSLRDIREENRYGGLRAKFHARLGTAQVPIQIDFGIGDAVTPSAEECNYPALLGMPPPVILVYPRETVIAEKLEAIVSLGLDNSRMKDYFDLWFLITTFNLEPSRVASAVKRTFTRREQPLPLDVPVGLSEEFASSPKKQAQWTAFLRRVTGQTTPLLEVVEAIREFGMPVFKRAAEGTSD